MGGKNKRKGPQFQSKPSGQSFVDKLQADRETRIAEQVEADERVKSKLDELSTQAEEAADELKRKKAELDDVFKKKLAELEEQRVSLAKQLSEIEARESAVLNMETEFEEERNRIRAETIAEVKADESAIRSAEYEVLQVSWSTEAEEQRRALEAELAEKRKTIDAELSTAHSERVAAETERAARIYSADADIQAKYKQLSDEYARKMAELNAAQAEYQKKKAELDLNLADLEGEREYIAALKKRYEGCSEQEIRRLQLTIDHLEEINRVSQERISEQSKRIARLEVRAIDNSGQSMQDRIDELERMLAAASAQLDEYNNMPSPSRIAELQHCEDMLKVLRAELDDTKRQLESTRQQRDAFSLDIRALENARVTAAALQSLNEQLQKKLQYITEQYKSTHESKFQGLLEIDAEEYKESERRSFKGSLADLADYIRDYGATPRLGETQLFYSIDTIRVFLASLAAAEPASRLIILQGLSGTGKSSLPKLFENALNIRRHSISVQPSWRDNRELLGYDNDFTNRFKETEFTKALYKASSGRYKNDIVLIVLDEMNLARIEYYFADFLSELEQRDVDWKIPLISSYTEPNAEQRPMWLNYDNGTANIVVGKNIWFIGTANNDDSTSLITDKVYDRAQILDMDERENSFTPGKKVLPVTIDFNTLSSMFAAARKNKAFQMTASDWATIEEIDRGVLQRMDITFGNRMKNQLDDFVPVYMGCGGTKEEAIDYFLAHKILRKLDEKYDAYVFERLKDLVDALNTYYGKGVFAKSLKKIETIKNRNFNSGD